LENNNKNFNLKTRFGSKDFWAVNFFPRIYLQKEGKNFKFSFPETLAIIELT
jgi:hypothetical protein